MIQELTKNKQDPQNILVIHFGQMGDVILALPAFRALRLRFPDSRRTVLIGKSAATIARIADVFDDLIVVDRVELRDGPKLKSGAEIWRIIRDLRRRRFDMVIDLHSLPETNLLGFCSGAPVRVYANRENRTLHFLAKTREKPPREDKSKHLTDRYLDVLRPLGIVDVPRFQKVDAAAEDLETIRECFAAAGFEEGSPVGFFPGAGHPSRRWSLDKFAALAATLREADSSLPLIVFLGPEEADLAAKTREIFPAGTLILDRLLIPELLAATSLLKVLVSNDTGGGHVGAIAGANLVLVSDQRAPSIFVPLFPSVEIVRTAPIEEISVEHVLAAVKKFL